MKTAEDLKLFIVDDDLFFMSLLQKQLQLSLNETRVTTFSDETKVLNCLDQNPDVIFLDYNMSTFSGQEVLSKIKRYNPNAFVVMVSAQGSVNNAVNALKTGAFDYIVKDENVYLNVRKVLQQITLVKEKMKLESPSFLRKVLKFI